MNEEEMEVLATRFSKGETTAEEELKIITSFNVSIELAKFFLNEIKVAKIKQELTK